MMGTNTSSWQLQSGLTAYSTNSPRYCQQLPSSIRGYKAMKFTRSYSCSLRWKSARCCFISKSKCCWRFILRCLSRCAKISYIGAPASCYEQQCYQSVLLFIISHNIIQMQGNQHELLARCLDRPQQTNKIVSLPLEFAYLPVDILSKEFTKLNSQHSHRVHYLGPRYANTETMHRKCAYADSAPLCRGVPDRKINKYQIDVKSISSSYFINEKMRTNHYYKTGLYYRAFEGMNPTLDLHQEFLFNGAFESGNLDCVIKVKSNEFDLFLRVDSNTRGHAQWFYFSVRNGRRVEKIKLNICNISKSGTLYQGDMKPYVFSSRAFGTRDQKWQQGGANVTNAAFSQKQLNYKILEQRVSVTPYCYQFEYQFQFQDDEVFFAYCVPYTYSQMLHDIRGLPGQFVTIHSLGRSLTGLDLPLLHITDSRSQQQKRAILITGRVHPGESNGSHVLKGFMNYLCSSEKSAQQIRKLVDFYILPMLNPDGVVLGNSRCSASGKDLNRIFPEADKQLFPEIHMLNTFVGKYTNAKEILLYFDFHGHSRKKNTFSYGPQYQLGNPNYLKCRVLPRMIEKINCSFRYHSCKFSISESKKTTGRAMMFQKFEIPYTYTIESSIGLYYNSDQLKTYPYDRESYAKMGMNICEGTSVFVLALIDYESFLKERKAYREGKRNQKSSSISRRNINRNAGTAQEESAENACKSNVLRIPYPKQSEDCLFVKLLQQVKKMPQTAAKAVDNQEDSIEASSDDHDQKQDFQIGKLKQFNNLIIQNARKEKLTSKFIGSQNGELKIFAHSNGMAAWNSHNVAKSQRDIQDQQQQFFEQFNIKPKPKSSNGLRTRLVQERSVSGKMQKTKPNLFRSELNEKEKNPRKVNLFIHENVTQENFGHQILAEHIKKKQKRPQNSLRSSIVIREQKKQKIENMPHFSEMQFPDEEKYEQKKLMKHHKTDLLRKNIERKRQNLERSRFQSLNFSEMSIVRHSKKKIQSLNQSSQLTSKKMVQFKIDDLMSNLQFRSKVIRDSVKYRDQRKIKAKSNFMFPSSFYGIKQQFSSKKRSGASREHSQNQQEPPMGLTVKQFYNK